MTDRLVKHGWHWSFGWLRRPEYDEPGWYCFEHPDGDMWLAKFPSLYLDCREDEDTGEIYTCRAPIPRKASKYASSTKPTAARRDAKR